VLLETLFRCPPKRLRQRPRIHMLLSGQLQLREQLLQRIRYAVLFSTISRWVIAPLVNTLSELRRHVERLNSRVHVARCALVTQANEFLRSHIISEIIDFLLNSLNISFIS